MELKPNISEVLSGYVPARPVGQGGMASIHLYENRVTGETLAVKSLHPHTMGERDAVTRFFHEVQASLRLDHINIVKVLGYGEWHSKPTMVMEFVDGGDLKNLEERVGIIPSEIACYITYQILKGLDYSHRLGIIHRDIKPSNILIDRTGEIKITDFGISRVSDLTRLTHSGEVLGTPAYMSPEQAEGKNIDERSDLFSTGVVLYEMLTNHNPFIAENPSITLLNIIRCDPKPIFDLNPAVSFRIENFVDKLITRAAGERVQSASDAAKEIKSILSDLQDEAVTQETFQQFLVDPESYCSQRRVRESLEFLERGKILLHEDRDQPEAAIVEFYKSLFLDPDQIEAQQYITSITEKFGFSSEKQPSDKILELEAVLTKDPSNVAVLLQLVKRCRAEGAILKAVSYSKRLARLRPKDPYILGQINTLLPKDPATEVMTRKGMYRSTSATSKDTLRSDQRTDGYQIQSKPPVRSTKSVKVSRGIDPFVFFVGLAVIVVAMIAIFVSKQFKDASKHMETEIPALIDSFKDNFESDHLAEKPQTSEVFTGQAKIMMENAQAAFKAGDISKAIAVYGEFLEAYPDHSQSDSIRMQLARLHQGQGRSSDAIRVLEDEIRLGRNETLVAYAHLKKIQILHELGRKDDARWACINLEPHYQKITSFREQVKYLMIYANLCEYIGDDDQAVQLYDRIINNYTNRNDILEARLLKAGSLVRLGDRLEAQRELWIVRDQSRPESLMHRTALEKLDRLGFDEGNADDPFDDSADNNMDW
jgi:serine/threonine protein kinase/predicted negative regulator of RcsB-dependent stress response